MTDLRPRGDGPTPVRGAEDDDVVADGPLPTYDDGRIIELKGGVWVKRDHRLCIVTVIHGKEGVNDPKYVRNIQIRPYGNPASPLPVKPQRDLPGHEITIPLGTNRNPPPVGSEITVEFERPAYAESHVPFKVFYWEEGHNIPKWA